MTSFSSSTSHLLVIEDAKGRRTIPLEQIKYHIGRHSSNHITIFSQQASRHHATLIRRRNSTTDALTYWIVDGDLEGNKSYNGIYINGKKISVYELKDGDLINFGCEVNASYYQSKPDLLVESFSFVDPPGNNIIDDTLEQQSYIDEVTQLPNKNLFKEYLSIAVNNIAKTQKILGVIFFEIVQFSNIKNKYGSEITEKLLYSLAERLKSSIRFKDIIFYWQEDQFVILLPEISTVEDMDRIGERIFTTLKQSFEIDTQSIYLKINSGFSLYPTHTKDSHNLIKLAQQKLKENIYQSSYTNKSNRDISLKTQQFLKIEQLLHGALSNQEFALYYQPQVNIRTGKVEGLEALLRWIHPKFGIISPVKFLNVAEETELIIPITDWVLKTVCEQYKAWQKEGAYLLTMAVNISSAYFGNKFLLDKVKKVLPKTSEYMNFLELELEVNEKTLLGNLEFSQEVLHGLNELGIKVTLDDFGLGYSSISCLNQLPINKLKISQILVGSLSKNNNNRTLIAAVIALGQTFQMEVVAEGVENQEHLEILHSLGCQKMQGKRFSKPLTVWEATEFLRLHHTLKPAD